MNQWGLFMKDEIRIVAEHFSRDVFVKDMQERNNLGLNAWEKRVVEKYFKKEASILNIGCGPGREAFALYDLDYKITGIDISEEEIKIAEKEAKKAKKDILFCITNGLDLNFPDESFDYIIMWAQAFGNVYGYENQIHLLKECHRVLKTGGVMSYSGHYYKTVKEECGVYVDGKKFYAIADTNCYWELFNMEEMVGLSNDSSFNIVECINAVELGYEYDTIIVCNVQK